MTPTSLEDIHAWMGTRRIVFANADLCTGCSLCELACADARESVVGKEFSRIRIDSMPEINAWFPVVCMQCAAPPCVTICPSRARSKDPASGAILIDADSCSGCGQCILACPIGYPTIHPVDGVAFGCDLCSGEPVCVEACTTGALEFVNAAVGARRRARARISRSRSVKS